MIWKIFLCKNKYYIVVVFIPNFYLSARSSSISLSFFLHIYGELLKETPDIIHLFRPLDLTARLKRTTRYWSRPWSTLPMMSLLICSKSSRMWWRRWLMNRIGDHKPPSTGPSRKDPPISPGAMDLLADHWQTVPTDDTSAFSIPHKFFE